jgi:hypothetical protein
VTTATAPVPSLAATRGRVAAAVARVARGVVARTVTAARAGGATAIGAAGLTSIAVGAGAQWGWPVGLMVGGPLAVWFASLLPGGDRQ